MANILIVLDGGYRFSGNSGIADFTYVTLVDTLAGAGHQITKAHRQSDPTADHANFSFASTLDLLSFDGMWLIGLDGFNNGGSTTKLPDPELAAIARFMAAGGGLFATGDHDSIGANMCGHIPRVRVMRSWFAAGDPMMIPSGIPRNFPPLGTQRADTTRPNPLGSYDYDGDGIDDLIVWFENQSDSVPQTIASVAPIHPILRSGSRTITVFPDHMHEGNTLGEVMGYPYDTQVLTLDGQSFVEFPMVAGHREVPRVIATGQTNNLAIRYASSNSALDAAASAPKSINTLSVYDGREAGAGRIVTGSTFHHYVDINLTGVSSIDTDAELDRTGRDAAKGHGFNDNPAVFDDIKTIFRNITDWIARPRPRLQIILDRSTFSQGEATANPTFSAAIFIAVDGLKPNQFPGGGISTLTPSLPQLTGWAPVFTPTSGFGINIRPAGVSSDDPALNDRLQRITFSYDVEIDAALAFAFPDTHLDILVEAAMNSSSASSSLTDSAVIVLVKSANPFMLDLANGNTVPWLSSDVRVFPVVAGGPGSPLPDMATRSERNHLSTGAARRHDHYRFRGLAHGRGCRSPEPLPQHHGRAEPQSLQFRHRARQTAGKRPRGRQCAGLLPHLHHSDHGGPDLP